MITKKDIQKLEDHFRQIFATKEELQEVKRELKHDILQFKDDILWEIKAMREELAVVISYRDKIEDHEERITQLEKKKRLIS